MLARILIFFAFCLYLLDIGRLVHEPRFSVVEKSVFLAAALVWVLQRKRDGLILGLLALTISYTAIFGLMTNYPQFSWAIYFAALNQFMVLYLFLSVYPQKSDKSFYFIMIASLPILSFLIGWVFELAGLRSLYGREFATGLYRLGGSLIPAFLSAFGMCAMIASLLLLIDTRKFRYGLLLLANLVITLLAGGRSTLVISIVMMSLIVLTSSKIRSDYKIISFVGGFAGFALLLATVGQKVLERFATSGDNGRDQLWAFVLGLADKYPIGIGYGGQFWSTPPKLIAYTGTGAAHNDFVRLSAELGYAGMVAFYVLLTAAVARTWWRGERNAVPWIGYLGFLLLSLSDNVLASPSQYILLVLGSFANSRDSLAVSQSREGARFWRMTSYAPRRLTGPSSS